MGASAPYYIFSPYNDNSKLANNERRIIMKMQETLHNWGGLTLNVITDEEIKDICLAIKYEDHGDEFLYIRTYSGEEYEYGYWLGRRDCWEDFDPAKNNGESDDTFIRRPILFKKPNDYSISNETLWYLDRVFGDEFSYKFREQTSVGEMNAVLERIQNIIDEYPNTIYNIESSKNKLLRIIKKSGLEENILDKIKWNSRTDGFDGIAGKRKGYNILYGDTAISVLYRGKDFDIMKLTYSIDHEDEWGSYTYKLNTKQFA